MRHLNVKWVPGTFAIISLTVATTQHPSPAGRQSQSEGCRPLIAAAGTKLIVISGERELKADVRTAAP